VAGQFELIWMFMNFAPLRESRPLTLHAPMFTQSRRDAKAFKVENKYRH
jgi:hypothetical protein